MRRQPTSPARRPFPRFRNPLLRLEFLEDREVPATLSLSLANAALVENGPATTATVTRTGDLSQALAVAVANSDATEASAPTSVTIAAGQASATFSVSPVDDTAVDGTQSVTLTATAATGPLTVRPDPAFGSGGYVDTPAVRGGRSLNPGAVLVRPDGSIVAAASVADGGNGWAVQLHNPDGSGIVTSYVMFPQSGGVSAGPGTVYAITPLADGRFLVAGDVSYNGVTDWAVARLNADGGVDFTFANGGMLVIPHAGYDSIHDLEVAADGTLLVGGFWADSPDFRVTRLSANGGVGASVNVPVCAAQADERAYGTIADMALDANGKLLLAGTETVYVASTGAEKERFSAVVRLNSDLTPDATFGPGGVRTLDGVDFGNDRVDLVAVEAVGSNVVVAGTAWGLNQANGRFVLARFNADGTLDTSFAGDGTAALSLGATGDLDNAEAFDLAAQPDGKLVVAGYAWRTGNGTNHALARFNANGTPDASFNGTGFYVAADYPAQGTFEQINAIALQTDGRLVAQAGGQVTVQTGPNTYTTVYKQWIARYDMATGEALSATASLTVADDDPSLTLSVAPASFSENGGSATATLTRTNLQVGSDLVVTLTSSDTTEATVPTTVTIPAGQASVTFAVTAVDDTTPDGTQAVTISATAGGLTATAGVSVTDDDPAGPALFVTIDRGSVLEQTGASAAVGTVTRYGFPLNVALTVTLSSSDITEATVPSSVTIAAGQTSATFPIATADDTFIDGTIAVTITASASGGGMSGPITQDTGWNGSGYVSGLIRGRVVIAPDGKLVVAGTAGTVGSNADFAVRRFTTAGVADSTFGSGGFVQLNPVGPSDVVEAVLVQPDGKVVVAGTAGSTGEMVVARLTTTGTTDGTFGQNGVARLLFGSTATLLDVALQADGKLVLSGSIGADFAVVRLTAAGALDGTFGTGGVVRVPMSAVGAKAYGVAVAADGRIVAAGSDGEGTGGQRVVVARFNTNGTPDASFGTGGVAAATFASHDERATDVSVQPDGKVLVGARLQITGSTTYDYAALRFNADGSPDTTFGSAGRFIESTASTVGGPARLILQPDGRVLLAGTAAVGGTFYARFVRLTSAGVLENRANGAYSVSSTEGIAQDAAGNIYLAYNYGSTGSSGYVDRYKSTGTPVIGTAGLSVLDNEPFAAANDSYTTAEETPLTVAAAGVRGNDTVTAPLSGTSVTAELVTGPARGTLTFNANGSFTYTPAANFFGTDAFTYRLRDGIGVSNTATVTLTVTNVNDAPVAANDSYTTAEDTPLTVAVAAGTTSLNMVSDPGDWIGQGQTYNLSPANGNFTLTGNASYLTVNFQHPTNISNYWTLQFRSPFDNVPLTAGQYLGAQRAAFRTLGNPGMDITGQHRGSNTLTGFFTVLQIEVSPTGQVTRFAADFEQHSEGGTPALRGSVRFNYAPGGSGVLSNDSDPDGNPLAALLVSGPAHGQLGLNANGTFTYTPDANYNGPDSFTYKANDGALDSNVATVNLTVTAVNDPPVGANDSATTAEDTPALIDVLANDTDIENNPLTIGALTQPQFGTVVVQNGRVLYTPSANWSGTTSFTYRPSDVVGAGPNGNVTTVTVTVTPTPDAPVAGANAYTGDQGITLTVNAPGVLGNDTDADGDALAASVVSGPANGVLTLNADGSFTYAPDPAFFGTDSFTYAAADGTGLSATATVTLTVLRTNDPPVAQDDTATTNEDQQVGIDVITNDSDPNGDPIVAVVFTSPANGTAQYSANDGRIYYMPRANWSGTDTFTYRAWDGRAYSDPATVTVTVSAVNDAPVALGNQYSVAEDTTLTVPAAGVLANDTDAENDPLTAVLVSGPSSGSLTFNTDGSFTYAPAANFFGNVTFTYRASDGQQTGNLATVTITVLSVNDAPVGNPDGPSAALTTNEDTPLAITYGMLNANDTDVEDASNLLVIGTYTQPANGGLTAGTTFGGLIYVPRANWSGTDTFQYRPMDRGQALGNWTTVTITVNPVNDAPAGQPDVYYVDEDGSITVPAAGVLANDTDPEGNPFTAVLVTGPMHGTVALNPDGSFTYTPTANYFGSDVFTYRPVEGSLQGNVTAVSIGVNAVNDPPVANPDSYTVAEDGTLTVPGAAPAIDQQSIPIGQLIQVYNAGITGTEWQQLVVAGRAGTLASFDLFIDSAATIGASFDVFLYKGAPWRTGTTDYSTRLTITSGMRNNWVTFDTAAAGVVLAAGESFTIGTRNGSGQNAGIHGSYSANGDTYVPGKLWYNNQVLGSAPNTHDLQFRTRMNAVSGVLANDTDPENNPLTAVLVGGPANGTVTVNTDGGFTYRPNANYFGTDSFTYKANDGALDSNVATVTVTVTPVNDAPTLDAPGDLTIPEDAGPQTVTLTGIGAGPGESQPLTVTVASSNPALIPTPTLSYTSPNATGTVTFAPVANASGSASITIIVNDGVLSRSRSFEVIVAPVNDAPVGAPESFTVDEDTSAGGNVLANDGDIDGNPVTAQLVSGPANGQLSLNPNGTFAYTPAANWSGTDTFTYRPFDGQLPGADVTVTIVVQPVNDAPVANPDAATVAEDGGVTVAVLANDADIDGDPLTVTGVTNGASGTVAFTAGDVTYTPAANFFGADTFTYTVSDGQGGTATGTVTVTVTGVNDAPTLNAINNVTVAEDAGPQTVSLGGIGAGPGETQTLTVTATSSNTALIPNPTVTYTSPNAVGTLAFTPVANANGTATITVTVSDGSLTATRTFTVTVTPVNDAPTLNALGNLSILEDAGQQTVNLTGIGAGPGETATLTVTASSSNTALIPTPAVTYTSANTTGSIRFTPAANATGTATITVTVSDGALTATRTFTVTVTAVNDAPSFTAGANQSVVAGSGAKTVAGWGDGILRGPANEGNQGLSFIVSTTNPALFVEAPSIDAAGTLSFIPEASATGTATVTVVLKDTGGTANGGVDTSVTRTFTITLTSNGLPTSAGVRMVGSELVVTGANTNDTVTVTPQGAKVRVQATLNGQNYNQTFNNVTRVRVDTDGGNDTINLSAISLPTWTDAGSGDDTVTGGTGADEIYLGDGNDTADGGNGNDFIAGGAGEDLIQGGAGNDDLYGGDGDDFVIGGPGLDDLYGGLGNDILVGGSAAVRNASTDSLRKVLTDWNPASTGVGGYTDITNRLTITDDGVADQLRGDGGSDWFLGGVGVDLELDTPEQRN